MCLKTSQLCSIPAHAGASITLYRGESIKPEYAARQAAGRTSPRAGPARLQALRAVDSSPQVSKRAKDLTQATRKVPYNVESSTLTGVPTPGHAMMQRSHVSCRCSHSIAWAADKVACSIQ